jgi:CO/xanthine dehydrogenase Mo-binding subunit
MNERNIVGQPLIRKDAAAKLLGAATYAGDIRIPGMLIGKALRSEYPHAKIVSIDTSAAQKMPGVHAVLTAKDIPGENRFGLAIKDQPVLAQDKVRMMGDTVALVAAVTLDRRRRRRWPSK